MNLSTQLLRTSAIAFVSLCATSAATASGPAACAAGQALRIRGDAPAAISFDTYSQLQPLSAPRLALLEAAGEVRRLPEGLAVCEIADDGVADPSAVLVHRPGGDMSWWVSAANVEAID